MRYIFDNDLHIHSWLSSCSNDPEQTPENILEYAKRNNLKVICITDHFWDSAVDGASEWYSIQNYEHIVASKPLPQTEGIKFLFGAETDLDKFMTVGMSKECFDNFDFVVIPTTHLHMMDFTIEREDDSIQSRAKLWVKRLDALLNKDLPFEKIGIAHLACSLIEPTSRENYIKVLDLIPDTELERLFRKVAKLGCGVELNQADMNFKDHEADSVLRIFKIAKKCGCKFYMASDSHHPKNFVETKAIFERAIDLLDLSEDDKFQFIGLINSRLRLNFWSRKAPLCKGSCHVSD